MKYFSPLLLLTTLAVVPPVLSQSIDYQSITMEVKPRQDTVLLGQPFFIDLVFTNHSNETVTLQKKGPFLKSKDEFLVISQDNDTTEMPEIDLVKGVCECSFHNELIIFPDRSQSYPVLVDQSAKIKKVGSYKAFFAFSLTFVTSKNEEKIEITAYKQGGTTFVVQKDENKFERFIETIAAQVKQGTILRGSNMYEQKDHESHMILAAIEDKRVIPYLAEISKLPFCFPTDKAFSLIARYPFDSLAFAVLKEAAQGPDDTYCSVIRDDSIYVDGARLAAIRGIMLRNDQQAIDFICALNNQDKPCQRYGIIESAGQYFSREKVQKLLALYVNDKYPLVRRKVLVEQQKLH